MARVVDFLEKLAADPEFEADFEANARQVIHEFGLSDEQGLLILGGTTQEVRDYVLGEVEGGVAVILIKMAP